MKKKNTFKRITAVLVGGMMMISLSVFPSSGSGFVGKIPDGTQPPLVGCDFIIDADGFNSPQDGIPGAVEVFDGAPLTDFASTADWSGTGVDMFDNDGSGNWTESDDLMTEGEYFTGVPGSRNKQYDAGVDKVILDKDGSLTAGQFVSFDLDGAGAMLRIRYYDANGNGTWDNGEDIVFDANGNYIYDEFCPQPPSVCPDVIIDLDGSKSTGLGDPATYKEAKHGDPLRDIGWNAVDMFDKDDSMSWTDGDDIHIERPELGGIRDAYYNLSFDQLILDLNGDMVDGEPVWRAATGFFGDFDMLSPTILTIGVGYYDANGNGFYDLGEDIVLDANRNYIYDETCPPPPPPPELEVPVDIKPQSCPNPLNVKDKGVLPVAILGTADFDVNQIDLTSIKLEGVSPSRSALEDVATPFVPFTGKTKATDCTTAGADGYLDLTLKFDNQAIVTALGSVTDGEVRVLKLRGNLLQDIPLLHGVTIIGEDVGIILKKK